MTEWEYTVQFRKENRSTPETQGRPKRGFVWDLVRSCKSADGSTFSDTLITSPSQFLDEEAAKHDAVIRLTALRCPFERPVDQALHWILDGGFDLG